MVQFSKFEAEKYRKLINKSADSLPDEEAATAPMLSEAWAAGVEYAVDKRVCYEDKLYKVLQAHTSQADWLPPDAPSLYAEVLIPDPSVIPDWVQPSSTNGYAKGDKVRHVGKVWQSEIDNNVWEPGVVGTETLWTEISD